MNIKITNIGKIKSANIAVNGLTVIAGENDTGKSTVGKLLFAIIKGISRYEQDLLENKEDAILRRIENLYFKLRRHNEFDNISREEFTPHNFVIQLKPFLSEIKQPSLFGPGDKELEALFKQKENILKELGTKAYNENIAALNEIRKEIFIVEQKESIIKRALERALFSEFYLELSPKGTSKLSKISTYENSHPIIDIDIDNNKITNFKLHDDLFYNDVTFIETPLLLQMYDVIRRSNTLFDSEGRNATYTPQVSLHIKDLVSKIEKSKLFSSIHFENNFLHTDVLNHIAEIIDGGFSFEAEEQDFLFTQQIKPKKNAQIKPVNTASGIKAFGIIQLLIQANMLNNRSLLIVDEPENHLHPKWQVEYARLIVELAKNDISVIISSHSPYMIQALKYFSDSTLPTDKVSYYLAESKPHEAFAEIKEVTNDLNKIFTKLAQPLKDLVWK